MLKKLLPILAVVLLAARTASAEGDVASLALRLLESHCVQCHGAGAAGVPGLYPNLGDDDWLWGGNIREIEQTIHAFRQAVRMIKEEGGVRD